MKINELIEKIRGSLKEEDLIPVKTIFEYSENENIKWLHSLIPNTFFSYKQIQKLADKLKVPIEHFFINTKGIYPSLVYFHSGLFLEIDSLDDKYIEDFKIKEKINHCLNVLTTTIKEKKYEKFFSLIDSRIKIIMFKHYFNDIQDENLYNIFLNIYTSIDYGFTEFNEKHFARIIKCKKIKDQQEIEKALKNKTDKNGYITIYRGIGNKSTPINKAYSWTTNISVATFFCFSFYNRRYIYRKNSHKRYNNLY